MAEDANELVSDVLAGRFPGKGPRIEELEEALCVRFRHRRPTAMNSTAPQWNDVPGAVAEYRAAPPCPGSMADRMVSIPAGRRLSGSDGDRIVDVVHPGR